MDAAVARGDALPFDGAAALEIGLCAGALGLFAFLIGAVASRLHAGAPIGVAALALGAALLRAAPAPAEAVPAGQGPDVLLVTIEGVPLGSPLPGPPPMPRLDALAAQSARWPRAFSPAAGVEAALASILLGDPLAVSGEAPTGFALVDALRLRGWATSAFLTRSDLGGGPLRLGVVQWVEPAAWGPGVDASALGRALAPIRARSERSPGETVRAALDAWSRPSGRPRLIWVHLGTAGPPFSPPPPWDTAWYEGDRYDPGNTSMAAARAAGEVPAEHAEITDLRWFQAAHQGELAAVDAALGALLDAAPAGAVVAVAGLGGLPFGREGRWLRTEGALAPPASATPLWLRIPGGPVATVRAPVSLLELGPTLAALAAGAAPPGARLLPRAVDGAGLRAGAHTRGPDGVALHDAFETWLLPAGADPGPDPGPPAPPPPAGARRWTGEGWGPPEGAPAPTPDAG